MKKAWPHIKCVLFIVVLAVVILVCDYLFAESGYIRFVLNDVNLSLIHIFIYTYIKLRNIPACA